MWMFFAVQPTLSLAIIVDSMHAQVMMIAAQRRNTAAPKAFHANIGMTSIACAILIWLTPSQLLFALCLVKGSARLVMRATPRKTELTVNVALLLAKQVSWSFISCFVWVLHVSFPVGPWWLLFTILSKQSPRNERVRELFVQLLR